MFLIRKADVDNLARFSSETWIRWSKIIVQFPYCIVFNDRRSDYQLKTRGLQQGLLHSLYQFAPQYTLNNFTSLLAAEDRRAPNVGRLLEKLGQLWDSTFEAMLLEFLQASSLSPQGQRSILDFLLTKDSADAMRVAEMQIASGYSNQNEKDLVVEIAASLMISKSDFTGQWFGSCCKTMM